MAQEEYESHFRSIREQYQRNWNSAGREVGLTNRRPDQLLPRFRVLEFEPAPQRTMCRSASCGISAPDESEGIELHICSPYQSSEPVE